MYLDISEISTKEWISINEQALKKGFDAATLCATTYRISMSSVFDVNHLDSDQF